jgi:hypothetical protein
VGIKRGNRNCSASDGKGNLIRSFKRPQSWTICNVDAREFECSTAIISTSCEEFGPMIGKREQVAIK